MLKQGASSHNLALHETQRQREEIPLLKGRTDLLSFKDKKDKKGSVKKKRKIILKDSSVVSEMHKHISLHLIQYTKK